MSWKSNLPAEACLYIILDAEVNNYDELLDIARAVPVSFNCAIKRARPGIFWNFQRKSPNARRTKLILSLMTALTSPFWPVRRVCMWVRMICPYLRPGALWASAR